MDPIKFVIAALPDKNQLETLNILKNYFYKNDFKYKNKPSPYDAHLSLAEGICNEEDFHKIKEIISNVTKGFKPITLEYRQVTNDVRGPIDGKCEFNNTWISILFESEKLQSLSKSIDLELQNLGISTTDEYIKSIKEVIYANRTEPNVVIANHINMCNYCRPEKADEAKKIIEQNIPSIFTFNRIVLMYNNGLHAWEIAL